ncbi:MAG TPA: tyrosine-type recombinase/integrase [Acidimicrobiales bacterium]|jgi:integrase
MTDLRHCVEDYLSLRRALGFTLKRPGQLLAEFVAFAESVDAEVLTVNLALSWATLPADADPSWWGFRLQAVRTFARWLVAVDPRTEVPPADLCPALSRRAEPYPYGDDDIVALLTAARAISSPLKAATYETLIGLLAVTGMRVGEAISLDRSDVDFDQGALLVRQAKFDKTREVALHPSTVEALRGYDRVRTGHWRHPRTDAFFVSLSGTRLYYQNVQHCFSQLVSTAGLEPVSARCRPRIHDLRHRFAVTTLVRWYRDGEAVGPRLPLLSTYLGHVAPSATYWYLRADPELLALAAERLEPVPGGER